VASAHPVGTAAARGVLDAAAGTPLHPAARESLLSALEVGYADPARLYGAGRRARMLLDGAREAVAAVLHVRPDEVGFAASGPAATQEVLLGALEARSRAGGRLLASAVEHSAVLHAAAWHAARTAQEPPDPVPVDAQGRVDPASYELEAARGGVAVASLQLGNGEVGTLQPVPEVAEACARAGVPLHVDASAAVGRVPVDVGALGAAYVSADARLWGGPPGVGVRVVRTGQRWRHPWPEPPAPPPVPLLVAAAAGLLAADAERAELADRHRREVERLRAELPRLVPDTVVLGPADPALRLPHLLSASFLYVDAEALVLALDRFGVTVGSGSACTADTLRPSHVLAAMGAVTHGNVRISLGRDTTRADSDRLLAVLPGLVAEQRATAGVAAG